jgi:hypothetical protein
VRRLLVAVTGALGLGALWRRRQRQQASETLPAAGGTGLDHAEELRAKLAETRAGDGSAGAAPEGPEAEEPDPETRRRELHERARSSIDELR